VAGGATLARVQLRLSCLVLTACFAATACRASIQASASADARGEGHADFEESEPEHSEDVPDFDKPLDPAGARPDGNDGLPPATEAPIGARQDLMFKGPGTVSCRCMSVALGPATLPAFRWAQSPPGTNPSTQFVVGFSSTPCAGAPEQARASYWGYEASGNDVIVVIENSREGRPITVGAIIPKPFGDGQVYLRPRDASVPFARGEEGRCRLGNPGTRRTGAAPGAGTPRSGIRIGDRPIGGQSGEVLEPEPWTGDP
jgi:hypothetical protein